MAPRVALVYDNDAHLERQRGGQPRDGVFGRDMANSGFADAWLKHGDWQSLVAVVRDQPSAQGIEARFAKLAAPGRPNRQLDVVRISELHRRFLTAPPAEVLHLPQPLEPELAWVRHHRSHHRFALSGVTHTISLAPVMERICSLVTAPFERYDTLFCTSKATAATVSTVADNYARYLRDRHGGEPQVRARIAHVPFGVDTTRIKPASPAERAQARHALGIAADEVCVLFFGRLSYHSKAHPFPMLHASSEAARRTGCRVHLLFAGWFESSAIQRQFQEGIGVLASGVKTTVMNATRPEDSRAAWHAADIFNSLSDNIQESLGLTLLEAQAAGLPVVTTDWDGCRDTIEHGRTGFVIATRGVSGATLDDTSRLLVGEVSQGELLGRTNQTIAVDAADASRAFERLFVDSDLRRELGRNARAHVEQQFDWAVIVQRYEAVWNEQEAIRREHAELDEAPSHGTPVSFPDVEFAFATYPSEWLGDATRLLAAPDAAERLPTLLGLPLTNYLPGARVVEPATLARVLEIARQPVTLALLDALPELGSFSRQRRRATLAWLLKYDLLRVAGE